MTTLDPHVASASAGLIAAHKRVVKEKNRTINDLQARNGELQRALQERAGEVVRAKTQAVDALDEAIAAQEALARHEDRETALRIEESWDRAEKAANMTARELLDAAWEAAYVPEDGIIPKGAWAIQREPGGQILTAYAEHDNVRAQSLFAPEMERRLLDPPAPKRPEWADLGEALDRLWPHGTDGIAREDIARRLHTEAGVRVVSEGGAS